MVEDMLISKEDSNFANWLLDQKKFKMKTMKLGKTGNGRFNNMGCGSAWGWRNLQTVVEIRSEKLFNKQLHGTVKRSS